MFASKPMVSSSNLRLPSVSKSARLRLRSSPIPSLISNAPAGTNTPENVSALKAKYDDYAMWLRAASRRNREPMFTHELLKHSLCQMGIDSAQADQLVSTCTWYVYQFQKEMEVEGETKKNLSAKKKRSRKVRSGKTKRTKPQRELSAESSTTPLHKENAVPSASIPPTRSSRYSVLPAINSTDAAVSPRSRRVDFDNDPLVSPAFGARKTSHWRSVGAKVRHLPKLRHAEIDSSTTITLDTPSETNLLETDLSSSQRSLPRHAQTRSILRKQNSIASSVGSVDLNHRNQRNNLLTPASTIVDEVPLGTKSQRLFGGSECFAQIMNELEEQAL